MAVVIDRRYSQAIHPFHAILLAGTIPWFIGAVLSDIAYMRSFHIQWSNFASWLLVGGLVFAGAALIFAIVDLARAHRRAAGIGLYVILLLATWIVGFINALWHARDAWATMPTGMVLSVLTFVLACATTWVGFRRPRIGGTI